MLVSVGATKLMAERLMQDFPHHGTAYQAIVDFAAMVRAIQRRDRAAR
jgi:hypothetical protein